MTNTVFISINNIHVIKDIRDIITVATLAPVSPPVAASLDVAGAAGGEAEGVYDHVSLVGADRHQLVVHVLLPARGHVSATSTISAMFRVSLDYLVELLTNGYEDFTITDWDANRKVIRDKRLC